MKSDLQLLTPAELMIQRFGKEELAKMLNITPHAVYYWTRRSGNIPHEHQRTLIMKYNVNADDLILGGIH